MYDPELMGRLVERDRELAALRDELAAQKLAREIAVKGQGDALAAYDALRSRVAELEAALRKVIDTDHDMGIYPKAVKGYGDERDYEQRDGFKNGWNAAVMEYGRALTGHAYDVGIQPSPDEEERDAGNKEGSRDA